MIIRAATKEDAEEASDVLRRSIRLLCRADHGDDEQELEAWLTNKSADQIARWISQPELTFLIALREEKITGVGAISATGEVLLNYVAPEYRFQGVSSLLLAALEGAVRANGCGASRLTSTATAAEFYARRGYRAYQDDPCRMEKCLKDADNGKD